MARREIDFVSTAAHEAAHAVASMVFATNLLYVTIDPDDPRTIFRRGHYRPGRTDEMLYKEAVLSLAGPAAERLFTGRFSAWGARSDVSDVMDRTLDEGWRRMAWRDAHALVEANREVIARVAIALLMLRRLSARVARHVADGKMLYCYRTKRGK